jgi:4'-phosphopantetheinyl transferase
MITYFSNIELLEDNFLYNCSCFLSQIQLKKLQHFRFSSDRIQGALGYLLLVYSLKKEKVFNKLPELEYSNFGKPFMTNYTEWHFNISHCNNVVTCIIDRVPVGIDVEKVREYDEYLAKEICSNKELGIIRQSKDPANALYELWTRKEAVLKWQGTGITDNLMDVLNLKDVDISTYYLADGNFFISTCKTKAKY